MKKCPICEIPLVPCEYENQRVMKCEKCHGYLVPQFQLNSIQRIDDIPKEELLNEAKEDFKGSVEDDIRCPKCRITMDKMTMNLASISLDIDSCHTCSLIWFDGGELALAQLGYEDTGKFQNEENMRKGMAELENDSERLAEFEDNLDKLKEDKIIDRVVEGLVEDMVYGTAYGSYASRM